MVDKGKQDIKDKDAEKPFDASINLVNRENTGNKKWDRILRKTKKQHMFVSVPLVRNIPLILCSINIFELADGNRHINLRLFALTWIIKLILAYGFGVYSGHLEWEFLNKLMNKKFVTAKEIRKNYMLIYGVWMFGINVTVVLLNPMFESLAETMFSLVMWPLMGMAWGFIMSGIGGSFSKYINAE